MSANLKLPKGVWRILQRVPRAIYRIGLGSLIGGRILLLTTTGRKSGLPRQVPLQYERVDGDILIGSARGSQADWYRNIQADPQVVVQVGGSRFEGLARTVNNPVELADFLELRLEKHSLFIGAVFRASGFPSNPTRKQLQAYAQERAMVVITLYQNEGELD